MTLRFDGWPWWTIGHIFYVTLSFVLHCIAIGEFKLELQSGNAQIASKLFFSRVNLKIEGWPRKTIRYLSYATSSFVYHFIAICEFKLELRSRNDYVGFWPVRPWPLTADLDILHGHRHWKFHDNTMKGILSRRCDRQPDRRTDRRIDERTDWTIHTAAWSQLKSWKMSSLRWGFVINSYI